ncbi:hypothetical protein Peternella1_53 [Winogradskyella phage Peternella_1]|uniref:Uncharacterized protein n=1 Tax=Winogradskyella phage Peternella_1 TaxID=2745699 RepID=A0A8E4ZGM1_9CAUD|nr:hypothetical protein M1M32_gp53 [Winogradskyella phage Peternella_1]QQV91589.1 hypothetical protein Peternella1_53 [Winogradskyella phage Peternella_1]
MDQNDIRDFNNETYTVPEGAAIVKELDNRTKHGEDGYNSIAELGTKVKQLYETKTVEQPYYANEAAMIAAQGTQTEGLIYRYDTPEISHFVYLGTTTGTIADYDSISQEEIDVILSSFNYLIKRVSVKGSAIIGLTLSTDEIAVLVEPDSPNEIRAFIFDENYSDILAKSIALFTAGEPVKFSIVNKTRNTNIIAKVTSFDAYEATNYVIANIEITGDYKVPFNSIAQGDSLHMFLPVVGADGEGGGTAPTTISIQPAITEDTTISGTQKGLNNLYPVNSDDDIAITVNKGTYAPGDVINFKRRGSGGVSFPRGEDVRLEGYRSYDNIHRIQDKGNLASIIFDYLDEDILVGSVFGDIEDGYSGAVETFNYSPFLSVSETKNITVTGKGFSDNMIVSLVGNATLNSFTVNSGNCVLNITSHGDEYDEIDIIWDNGDVTVDASAITLVIYESSLNLSDLITYLKFNGNVIDETGNHAPIGTGITYVTGIGGQALSVTGSGGNFVKISDSDDLSFGDGVDDFPFSITTLLKLNSVSDNMLFCKRDAPTDQEYVIRFESGNLAVLFYDYSEGSYIKVLSSGFTFLADTVYGLGITYDGSGSPSGIKIKVDNSYLTLITSSSGTYTAMENLSQPLKIGARWSTTETQDPLDGTLQYLGFWDVELDTDQLSEIYYKQSLGISIL